MKFNSVENAEVFLEKQVNWCLENGDKDFSMWRNGKELIAASDDNDIYWIMYRDELKIQGYRRVFRMIDGKQVSAFNI